VSASQTGVVVMAYGTPRDLVDVPAYYTDIRRGRPPTPEQLADLTRRYEAIGGVSPLAERTAAQVAAIGRELEELAPGRFVVTQGAKHAEPKIEHAVEALAESGIRRFVGVVLAPHHSAMSVGDYIARARGRAEELGLDSTFVERWHDDPALIEVLAERVRAAFDGLGVEPSDRSELVVSAHSLPERILATGDRYPQELRETAELVAAKAGVERFRTGWQSAGRTSEPWLGPDILELLGLLAADGVDTVVVCPAGFTSDHLEVLYDLDIEARRVADELGLGFARTASLNDEPRIAAALARRVAQAAGAAWPV
jgi:ferrochelatase